MMMGFYLAIMLLLGVAVNAVIGNRFGAPPEACSTITPGHGDSMATGEVPYTVDISSLTSGYVPGQNYTIMLSGTTDNPDFRGFLVQGRVAADGTTTAGTFIDNGDDQQVVCDRSSSVTHVNNTDKTVVELTWNAPAAQTGPILFRFAFVDTFSMFWANQATDTIDEVTVNNGTISPSPTMMSTSLAHNTTTSSGDMTTATDDMTSSPATPTNDAMTSTSTTSSVTMSPTETAGGDDGGASGVMAASSVLTMLLAGIITLIN